MTEVKKTGESGSKGEKESKETEVINSIRDTTNKTSDEVNKIVRGYTLGYLESVNLLANTLNTFVDEVSQKSRVDEKASTSELVSNLPRDIFNAYIHAVDKLIEIPGKSLDKYQDTVKSEK